MVGELANKVYQFGMFRLDPTRKFLSQIDGPVVPLTPKAFDLLLALVESRGRLVTKDELMKRVWTGSFVEEANLTQTISVLRRTLGENPGDHRFILTEPGRGYRFIAQVAEIDGRPEAETAQDLPETFERSDTKRISVSGEISGVESEDRGGDAPDRKSAPRKSRAFVALIFSAALIGLAVVAYVLLFRAPQPAAPVNTREIKSIAVLPFKTIGADDENKYIGSGMMESLIIKLSKIKQIAVRQPSAVLRHAETTPDPVEVGNALKVDALLDGTVQKDGERVRVSVRLVRVSDHAPLWAETFDDQFTNLFDVQDSISEKVVAALTLELTGEERLAVKKRYTNNLEADQLYQKGRYFWNKRTREGFFKAIELFEQAINKDAAYALPYTGLADSYHLLGDYSYLAPQDSILKAKEAALKALELDNTLSEAHTSLAYAKFLYDWDWPGAENSFKRALELNPNYATAHQWYGEYLIAMGRTEAAMVEIERARSLDPQSPTLSAVTGWKYYIARDYDRAIGQCRNALEMDPDFYPAHFWIGQAAEKKGDLGRAVAEYQTALKIAPESPEVLASLGHAYARSGQKEKARQILAQLNKAARQSYISPYLMALVQAGLGETSEALEWLEKGSAERSRAMPFLKVDPMMDSLRADSRFTALLRRMKLE